MSLEIGPPDGVCLWCIYRHPTDYPAHYVMRRQWATAAGKVVVDPVGLVFESLAGAREALPPGLVNIGRMPEDDRAIAEVWI